MEEKICSNCLISKPIEEFHRNKLGKGGRYAQCKSCKKKKTDEYRAVNNYKVTRTHLETRYGLPKGGWDDLFNAQGQRCAIAGCKTEPGWRKDTWVVDHDHSCCSDTQRSCGKCVRGILCHSCNKALGNVMDSTEILEGMIKYLLDNE